MGQTIILDNVSFSIDLASKCPLIILEVHMSGHCHCCSLLLLLLLPLPRHGPFREGISLGDIHCAPTRWVLAFFPEFLNFSSNAPKYRSLGGGGYVYTF